MPRHFNTSILLLAVVLPCSTPALAESQSAPPSSGLALLTRVAKKYAEAKTYYIESVEERDQKGDYRHYWSKTVLRTAQSSQERFLYWGRSEMGVAERASDGKTVWTYLESRHRYTAKPYSDDEANKPKASSFAEQPMVEAEALRRSLGEYAKPYTTAEQLPDARLKINGHKISCAVVLVRSSDSKRPSPSRMFEKTIWIDKRNTTILKVVEHGTTHLIGGAGKGIPLDEYNVTTFTNTILDGPISDQLFTFTPPADAKLIDDFPDPGKDLFGNSLVGEKAPPIKLKSADGNITSLESFRGKPVLIDIWSTWCAPCLKALPSLAKIYEETRDKGLVLISVDRDEEAKTASDFFAKNGYTWPDFHDAGDIEKVIGVSGIPRVMLINADGKIMYDSSQSNNDEIRSEIAKLGPEYASLRAKQKQNPCGVSGAEAIDDR